MSQFEEFDSEDNLSDPALQELASQLKADADHLQDLFPPMHSRKLDDLVSRCLVSHSSISHGSDPVTDPSVETPVAKPLHPKTEVARKPSFGLRRVTQVGIGLCMSLLLIGTIAYLNPTGESNLPEPLVSSEAEPFRLIETTPVSVHQMPPEFLNASQPELEALYDLMPNENVCIEF